MTLSDLTQAWLSESLGALSAKTAGHYRFLMETYVLPAFGERTDISSEEIESFVAEKKASGLSEGTIYSTVRILRRILDFGAGLGVCESPDWGLEMNTPKKKRNAMALTPSEEKSLSDYLVENPTPKHLGLFLMLTCGIQIGEVVDLQWKDVSLQKNQIRVNLSRGPVTNRKKKTRVVPLTERQKIYLRKQASLPENYLCSGTPTPCKLSSLETRFRNVIRFLGLPHISPKDLRHTYAVRCIEGGMSYEELSKRLGLDNGFSFRDTYRELVSEDQKDRLERERFESRKVRVAPAHIAAPEKDPEIEGLKAKIEEKRKELKAELEALEGDLQIIHTLRNSDCVQGSCRGGLYSLIEKVLGDDKDGKYLVEYLRCNMRVASMPLAKVTTVQAIRRRVTHGFEKLTARIDDLNAAEGWDIVDAFRDLCSKVKSLDPPPAKRGARPKPSLEREYREALEALEREKERK